MAFADFDNDGELEMLTISPFHGEKISIFKKQDGEFKKVYTYEKRCMNSLMESGVERSQELRVF